MKIVTIYASEFCKYNHITCRFSNGICVLNHANIIKALERRPCV